MLKLDDDIKVTAKSIIQGNEKRKRRIKNNLASRFDIWAVDVVSNALSGSCSNISCNKARQQMQEKIYKSILYNTPYEYLADVACGRRQFYDYRKEFIRLVAKGMGMIPGTREEKEKEKEPCSSRNGTE